MAVPTSRRVCCCGVDTWAKTIAWTQIVFFAFTSVGLLQLLYALVSRGETRVLKLIRESKNLILIQYHDTGYGSVLALVIFLLILSIIAFSMAFVLLSGVKKRSSRYLLTWIVYTTICLVLLFLWIVNMIDKWNVPLCLVGIALSVSVVSFGVSLVFTLKEEFDGGEEDDEGDNLVSGGGGSGKQKI